MQIVLILYVCVRVWREHVLAGGAQRPPAHWRGVRVSVRGGLVNLQGGHGALRPGYTK
jgi:hypothetical protein